MDLLAAILAYTTPWFVSPLDDAGKVALGLTAVIGLLGLGVRYLVIEPIKREIDSKTKPIQPDSNGGRSLVDVHTRLQRLEAKTDSQDEKLDWIVKHLVEKE